MKIDLIAGARPNFMKIAPILQQIEIHNQKDPARRIQYRLIHTGQHYDQNMSGSFFDQLGIPEPQLNLGAGAGTQAAQTAQIMIGYEEALSQEKPDLCIVVGDVNSTMACAIVAKKALVQVAHVEAGIRSGDMSMPEEINRIVTDSITDYFFTTSEVANAHLLRSGTDPAQIFLVGNTMIDSLLGNLDRLVEPDFYQAIPRDRPYLVLTLHRPSNVDDPIRLATLLNAILEGAQGATILFPMHPRTRKVYATLGLTHPGLQIVEPLPYLEFMYIVRSAAGVVTDSGGITEETTVLDIPCITLRDTTERPETIHLGTNELITDIRTLSDHIRRMLAGEWKRAQSIPFWDGHAAVRIVNTLVRLYYRHHTP